MKRREFVASAVALSTCGGSRAAAQTPTILRIGVIPGAISGQAFFAKDLGMFERAGFAAHISPLINGPAIASALLSGALDVGFENPVTLAIAHDKGLQFTILTAANMYDSKAPTTGQLLVLKTSPIRTAKALTGKTIAAGAIDDITQISARAWIDANGGDSSSVHFIEMPLPAMPAALQADRIDGAMFNPGIDPTMGKPNDPFRIVAYTFNAYAPLFAAGMWVSSTGWVTAHPAEAGRVVRVMREAAQWADTHPREAAHILATNLKEHLRAIESTPRVNYGNVVTPSMIQPIIDLCWRYGVIHARFPAQDLLASRRLAR